MRNILTFFSVFFPIRKRNLIICFFLACMSTGHAQWLGTNPVYFNAGNVGIGTSSPYSYSKLHIKAPGNYPWTFLIEANSSDRVIGMSHNGSIGIIATSYLGTGGHSPISFFTSDLARMTIDVGGNIGIGNSSPASLLHLTSSSANGSVARFESTSTNGRVYAIGSNFITGTGEFGIYDYTASADRFHIASSGNIGIGTVSPQNRLDVNGSIQISNASIPMGLITEIGGTTPLLNMSLNFSEPNKTNSYRGGNFRIDSRSGAQLFQWYSRSEGSSTPNQIMVLTEGGRLGIGTGSPDQLLTVNGNVHSKEVKVDLSVPAPDYVFEKDYNLLSLEEIKTYIDQNKHLPEVPSAKEMEANGIQLGEMNLLLLKKIEEMTLHMINQQHEIENLKSEMKRIENKN